jgi:hypothetical protein
MESSSDHIQELWSDSVLDQEYDSYDGRSSGYSSLSDDRHSSGYSSRDNSEQDELMPDLVLLDEIVDIDEYVIDLTSDQDIPVLVPRTLLKRRNDTDEPADIHPAKKSRH